MKLTRLAHAKLNLFLEITGKYANGYHELFSLVVFLDLADEISVEPADIITVYQINGNLGITDNIIYKTADKLKKKYKVKPGARITFTKNIPIGGGLGGGSADAATTLVLLNTLWELNLSSEELYAIALELGADVPVCLYSVLENTNAAIFSGTGEVIDPAPKIPEIYFTLVNPAIELSTKAVFENFKYEGLGFEPLPRKGDLLKNIIIRTNDLETAAIKLVPQIEIALIELAELNTCILSRMTGSGATSFGIFKRKNDARDAAVALIKKYPNWQIGPVGLKKIPKRDMLEKLKRPFRKRKIRTLRKLHLKTLAARNFGLSTTMHLILVLLVGGFFVYQKYSAKTPEPEFVTVKFGVETPHFQPVPETEYEPASGDEELEAALKELPPPPPPKPAPVIKKITPKSTPKKPKAIEPKLGKPAGTLGNRNGNTTKPAKPYLSDYLQLLQYTVQQRSIVPKDDPSLKGRAILHLAFNRKGYVLAYNLKQSTGSDILDKAATNTAKNLMNNPFPPAPWDFDIGEEVLEYDFVISYPRKR